MLNSRLEPMPVLNRFHRGGLDWFEQDRLAAMVQEQVKTGKRNVIIK